MEDLNNFVANPYLFGKMRKDFEIIDEGLENFDLFNIDATILTDINSELNKYQGLMSFARYIEQNEKKNSMSSSWLNVNFLKGGAGINSPLKKKTNKSPNLSSVSGIYEEEKQMKFAASPANVSANQSIMFKTNNFNILFPPKMMGRTRSLENRRRVQEMESIKSGKKKKQEKKKKRCKSLKNLNTFSNLLFLDHFIHEYMSQPNFHESHAEHLRKIKLNLQEIFKIEQEANIYESFSPRKNENLIKPRRVEPWGELWEDKAHNISILSPYGHFPSYQLRTLIIKGGDDLRQELIAMQIIKKIHKIFQKADLNLYLRPYDIIVTSANSGIIGIE